MKDTINIKEYINMFKKRWWIILIIVVLSTASGYALSYIKNQSYIPIYQTETRIRINTAKTIPNQGFSPATTSLNQSIVTTYLSLAKSKSTMNELINSLGLELQPEMLAANISLIPDETNSEFVTIRVTNVDPKFAVQVANKMPEAFNNELIKTISLDCVQVIDQAVEPKYPIPQVKSSMAPKATIAGIVLSIFVVLLLEFLNNKIITPEDVEEYWEVEVIGVIPYDKPNKKKNKEAIRVEVN